MTKQRMELLKLIGEMGDRYPDWRLGQILINVAGFADAEPWDVEDDQLLDAIQKHLAKLAKVTAA